MKYSSGLSTSSNTLHQSYRCHVVLVLAIDLSKLALLTFVFHLYFYVTVFLDEFKVTVVDLPQVPSLDVEKFCCYELLTD